MVFWQSGFNLCVFFVCSVTRHLIHAVQHMNTGLMFNSMKRIVKPSQTHVCAQAHVVLEKDCSQHTERALWRPMWECPPKCFGKFELFASKICNLGKESESKSENVEVDLWETSSCWEVENRCGFSSLHTDKALWQEHPTSHGDNWVQFYRRDSFHLFSSFADAVCFCYVIWLFV